MATKKPRAPYLNEPVELNFDALDQFMATLPQQQAPVEKSSMVRRALGDTGIAALKGVIGWPEALVGMADLVSGGQAGKLAEEAGFRPKEAKAILDEYLSPEQQAANQAVQQAEGFVGKGVAAITNPSVIWQNAVESAPSMLGGGVIARGALAAVPRMSPIVAAGIGEGAVTAGQNVEQVRQETPDGLLTPTQSGVVAASGALTGGIGIVAGKIAKSLGIGDVDVLLTGVAKASPQVQKGFVRRVLEGALTEGVLEELPQSTQEQVAQNLALGKPLDEGVDHAAVLGMLAGGLMGAVAGPMGTPQGNAIRDERLPEVGPLTKALNTATEQRAQMADAGKSVTPDQATVSAKARIDELGKKEAGTPDEELPGPNGEPVTVSGTPPQILSAGETQEKQFLEANKDNPAVLAGAKGKVVSPIPGAIDADVALERMRDQLRTDEAIVKAREREADAAHAATLQPQPEPESDAAPAPEPTDILSPSGGPWKAKLAAQKALKSRPDKADLALASVAGGYVLRRKPDAQQPDVHESPPVAAVADAGGSDQPAGSSGPVGPVAVDATGGSAPAAAAPAPSSGEAELLADGGAAPDGAVSIAGEPIDAEWRAFTPESGTKGVPRAEMPQIKAEHRGALTQFMLGRGIEHTQAEVNAADLKPTQQEFSPAKVDKAREFVGEDRAILVSNDGYVLDGHHQWLAKRDEGLPIRVIAFNAPIDQLVDEAKQFPSAEQAEGATDAQAVRSDEGQVRSGEPSQGTATEGSLRPSAEQGRGDLQQPAPDQTGEHGRQAEVAPTAATRSSEQAKEAAATEAKPERAADNREDAGSTVPAGSPESAPTTTEDSPEARWTRMPSADRLGILGRAGWSVNPPSKATERMQRISWDKMSDSQRERISAAMEASAAPQAAPTKTEQTHGSNEGQEGKGRRQEGLLSEGTPAAAPAPLAQPALEAQTTNQEKPDDSPAPTPAPALDHEVAEGSAEPAERSGKPRARTRRGDDRGVRGQGGLFEGVDDAGGDVGNSRGANVVPDTAPEPVERDSERVSAPDFRAGPGALDREGSWFATAQRNVDLIDLARKIESENRPATPEEQAQLAKYVGFGASEMRNALFPVPSQWQKREDPDRLIWPDLVREARWKPLAERLAALPVEWQKSVLQSTQYAHYTSEGVIRSTWHALRRIGFTGGKVLEPGMGIGSFAMLMPDAVRKGTKYTGIEFDGPTALIARLLSPQQNMLHDDFIKRRLPKDYFDVAIGNPPFAKTVILADPDYEKHGFSLHDFFFAKSLDRVRPGGLLAFVTSHFTMDKQGDKARKYMAARADLLGAIRLPQTAFEGNAGTSVTTDVIFLRKRIEGEAPGGMAWADTKVIDTPDGQASVNEYFADHPEMVLGQQRLSGNRDDQGRYISGLRGMGEYAVVSYDTGIAELEIKFAAAVEHLPQNVYSVQKASQTTLREQVAKVEFDPKIRREGVVYLSDDGTLMRVTDGVGKELTASVRLSDTDQKWFKSYLGIRDLVQQARATQFEDGDWEAALKKLNKAYDAFRKTHGPINDFRVQVRTSTDEDGNTIETPIRIFKNRRLFREDYDSAIVTQLEHINEAGEIVKAPFLLGRTIGKPVTKEVKTIGDALAVSLDETGHLDLDDIARRINLTRDEAIAALDKQIYRTPQGEWQLADEYLSGDVVRKLDEAMGAVLDHPDLQRNVEALKAVQPEKLGPSQISVKLGASWVPANYVNEFSKEIGAGAVTFDPKTESWQVEGGNLRSERRAGLEYGTTKRSPSELLEAALNSRSVGIKDKVKDGDSVKEVTDQAGTAEANEKMRRIKDKFKSWVWTDSERAADLVEQYNKRFNNIAGRRFDGSHLTLPGVSLRFKLHPHQLRAIWRQIQTGDTYLAHAVGAGKTIEMIAGGMEQRRLGLIRKPIYVVPNHMLEQFSNEFMELYPLANIMVADDENFSAERRKSFVAAATLNAPDAIVITHSAFERIGVKEESVAPIRDAMIDDLQSALNEVGKDERVRRGQLQQQIEQLEQRFDSILGAGKKDSTIKFEDIGADFVYVDEAHAFRKLDFITNQKIKGIDPNGSRRALDMYVKTLVLEKARPGRAMVFASGTPVTNTMGELYTVMRFFADDELHRTGTAQFDSWARQFGEAVTGLEANAAGKYETVERFAKFDNVPELMSRVRQFMDVLTSEQLGVLVKRPDIEGGKPNLVTVEPTDALKQYMKTVLVPRLEASKKWKPKFFGDTNPDPVIAITTDGRFAALDPRFFGAKVDDTTPTKLTVMADRIAQVYKATAANEYTDRDGKPEKIKGSTQIVFYNTGFGADSQKNRGFNSRGALTKRLTDQGVKREHILWFDDANTDAKKEAMFKAMRSGEARILIGSAKKMGTGVNVQKRLKHLHYFDPPWYPSDVEQPHGRIIRQGNQNEKAGIDWYATKGTYDSTMWQMVGRKQRFIDQAFTGDKSVRSMDDLSEASLYEQAAAVASGDPRALQLAGLKQDLERLERLQAAHANEQVSMRAALRNAEAEIAWSDKRIATYEKAMEATGGGYFRFETGKVGSRTYERHGEFGDAIKALIQRKTAEYALNPDGEPIDLGTIGSLPLELHPLTDSKKQPTGKFEVVLKMGPYGADVLTGSPEEFAAAAGTGLVQRMVNAVNGVDSELRRARDRKSDLTNEAARLRKKIGAPFEHSQALVEKIGELRRLEEDLKDEGKPSQSTNLKQTGAPEANETDVVFRRTGERAQQLADHLSDVWANAPRVVVVDSMADPRVPQVARDELARQDEGTPTDGKTTAFYYNDTVYLIGEQNERQALTSLFHEALGHHGLRHVFGGELRTILDRIAQLNPGLVRAKAKQYGLDFDKTSDRRIAAEEVLAEMAQTRPQLGWVKRALAAIRSWLRQHVPGFRQMQFSDDELIRSFILPARAWVENGAPKYTAGEAALKLNQPGELDPAVRSPSAASDVRFSRVSDAIDTLKSATTEKGLRDILSDHLTSDKTFNWWHNTIGTQYQKAKADPTHFGPVYEAAQDYLHDTSAFANDAAALAPDVVPQLKGWRDAFKPLRLSDADEQALASAIFTGTLQDQKVYTPDELRAQFNATDRQIALYQQMRAAIDRSLDTLVATDVARYLGQDIPKAIKDMISDGDTGRFKGLVTALAQQEKDKADAALTEVRKANRKRLSDMHRAHKKRREAAKGPMARSNLEDVLATERAEVVAETKAREDAAKATYDKWNEFERTIKAKYERVDQLKQEGYAPLMRFGRYTVDVVSDEGERQFFGLYESEADAKKAAREFRESGEFAGSTITTGLLSQEAYRQFSSMSPETLELFAEVSGVEQTPLFQEYLRRAKSNRAAIKRLIQRKGIAGFSEDAQRVLAAFVTSNARAASTNLHMGDMGRLIEAIPKEKGDVKDEAIRLKEYVQNPAEEAQRLRGLLFVQYLGGSIASALVNMTQPLTMTLPYLSQFGGLGKAGARLADAMKSAMHKQTGALGAALAKAEKEGIVSPQELHQLQAESSRTMGNHPGVRRLLFAWGSMFSLAEQFNRRVSFIAAWNTAVANGNPNPYQFAVDAVEQTQGVYNRGNRPNWARGPVGATVFTFKQFSISYLEFLKRLPPKERAIALAILVLAAGAQGLPFADDLDDLIDTIGQHLGYDTNAKLWKTKVLTEALGEMGADFALHGFSALPGFPLDVSGRLAISNLIPGTGILRKNTSDKSSDVFEAIGPAGGVVRDAIRGDVVPLAFRNLAKSIQMYQTGEYRDYRDRKVMDVTGLDALVKGIGFQPAEVARESRGIQMRNQQVQLARNVEAEIASLWAQGIADKEPDKVREARQRLADWNRDNPQSRIGITTGQLERRVREMRKTRQQRFEKAMPKEMRGTV